MATPTKKGSKTTKTKLRRPKVKTSVVEQAQTIADLREELEARNRDLAESLQREKVTAEELQDCKRQLTEALEQQTATSDILRVIASSPSDLQTMLDAIAESAARLCAAKDAVLLRLDGDILRRSAHYGPMPTLRGLGEELRITRGTVYGRAFIERRTIHIKDIVAEIKTEFLESRQLQQHMRARTLLATPLLREGTPIGVVVIRRAEVHPFTEKQIALLQTFADQAVIAIENVRLFKELGDRNAELREALEHQTATSEVLGIISRSPTDVQPVLDAIVDSAARVCSVDDVNLRLCHDNAMVSRAHFGPIPLTNVEIGIDAPPVRRVRQDGTLHILDVWEQNESARFFAPNVRSVLLVPLRQQGEFIGILSARRTEVRAFTPAQIKLLETFADQAVIAIENVRLFQELKEALEQQTATSEILGVIASSPTDIQPVLDVMAENAARLCDAVDAVIGLPEGDKLRIVAKYGAIPAPDTVPLTRGFPAGRAVLDHQTIHIHDILREIETEYPDARIPQQLTGTRTVLQTPLLREGVAIGYIAVRRTEVRPFTEKQIALLKTFADQAVIAIENVRLFKEIQDRNAELREALEHQTATAEVLGIISRSPTDVQPVLDSIVESAARVCEADDAIVWRVDGIVRRLATHFGPIPIGQVRRDGDTIDRGTPVGRAVLDQQTIHVHDLSAAEADFPLSRSRGIAAGLRTVLATPLLQKGIAIGAILIRRREVRPFSNRQIKLLETFADQAVIAIENVRLFTELQERNAELREALEHQTATSEVLGIISRSPTEVQPVLDAIVESAARVCGIDDVALRLIDGNFMVPKAHFGPIPVGRVRPIDEPQIRWVREHGTLHVPDVLAQNDFPTMGSTTGSRTFLLVPLCQQGELVGIIVARRVGVRPFAPAQITLLETFASQAVIAIENARLFQELKEALEQQTATSEILGVIANSPTDIQPVLDVVARNAARLCDSSDSQIYRVEGEMARKVASYGAVSPVLAVGESRRISRGSVSGRAILDRQTVVVDDYQAESGLDQNLIDNSIHQGIKAALGVPLLRENISIGAIVIRRMEPRPFTAEQILLLKTFASQAVIAIENVRLFNELKEALEQQTATSEILGVIASSPTDIQPVLDAVAANAAKLCNAIDAQIFRVEQNVFRRVASYGPISAPLEELPLARTIVTGRAILERQTIQVQAGDPEVETEFPDSKPFFDQFGFRTLLVTPLLREGISLGAVVIRRVEPVLFTEKQITLLKTFADQAVIAIENVRLFQELEARTRQLARSVGELKALGEVGQAVSSTLDLETVLTRIVSHAVQLSGTDGGAIYEYDDTSEEFLLRATDHMEEELINALRANPPRLGDGVVGKAALSREPIEVPDILEERAYPTRMRQLLARHGFHASLAVPLLREEQIIGGLVIRRKTTGPFQPEVVELLKTFATQSVLAIQNARLFREIENKSREIEAANQHKSEFLANMSHELRTPLTAIIGFSEVLSDQIFGELNEKQNEYMGDIVSSGRHLLSLINDILDLSKVEAGRMELDVTRFDLPMAIENALILIRERATRHGIKLEHNIDEHLGEVAGDERKFKQILINLLSNAVKFTPEGGSIGVSAALATDAVEVAVSDTGIGIAAENQEAIFEEFRQVGTDASKKREGTGLGLTLTKKFVELHGGRIWVESTVGKGSTFTFTLPLNQEKFDGARINPDH